MSITIENNLKDTENKEIFEQKVHYIPCKIEEDGPANVKRYFEPYIVENENGGKKLILVIINNNSCIRQQKK